MSRDNRDPQKLGEQLIAIKHRMDDTISLREASDILEGSRAARLDRTETGASEKTYRSEDS